MTTSNWPKLRSDIYLRDKGMCWVCNTFVNLEDYDLGHLIDRCNGGHDDYDNLAVMHKPCNLAKPHHTSLEECLKWKLTAFMPQITEARGTIPYSAPQKIRRQRPTEFRLNPATLVRRQELYKSQIEKIKPATIVWIQGRPMGGPMWKVLPPPYKQEFIFTMRLAPPGAIDNGHSGVAETLQVIGGTLKQDIHIELGTRSIHIYANNGNPQINFTHSLKANIGKRELTIGMGKGQIPIEAWRQAKAQGISLADFKTSWFAQHNPESCDLASGAYI